MEPTPGRTYRSPREKLPVTPGENKFPRFSRESEFGKAKSGFFPVFYLGIFFTRFSFARPTNAWFHSGSFSLYSEFLYSIFRENFLVTEKALIIE